MSEQNELFISVHGARQHNLKNISLEIPRNKLVVFTGLSGSGKSSLAFDTIYAEGQRRYVESLSAYARQFLGQLDKPDVDFIEGLSPAISIDQKSASHNPRSTVGTTTEIYDYLRLLYARIGVPHCPNCHARIERQTPQQIVDAIMALPEQTRLVIKAPVVRGRKGEYSSLLDDLAKQGWVRAEVDGQVIDLAERGSLELARYETHDISVLVDRLILRQGIERRVTESVEAALELGKGVVEVEQASGESATYSEAFACVVCGTSLEELEPRDFSFNSPWGACPRCSGLGTRFEVDPNLVVPDPRLSVSQGAIAPWASRRGQWIERLLEAVADAYGFSLDTPWEKLKPSQKKVLLYGAGNKRLPLIYRNRYGRQRRFEVTYEGVVSWLEKRHSEADSETAREAASSYMREVPCPACNGARLKPSSLAVTIGGLNIAELCNLSVRATLSFLETLELSPRDAAVASRALKEIRERLAFLVDVGLDYLTLSRSSRTLAGGEAQRIRLASQIGSGLVGVLYVLDEPSIGLHPRDNARLVETLLRLRDLGNTVIVVEHDEETIRAADWIVDIGPLAGERGGQIVFSGTLDGLLASKDSLTGQYLSGKRKIPVPESRRKPQAWLTLRGARLHNLKNLDVSFPLGCLVLVTGVSGSGKSTLVNDLLLPAVTSELRRVATPPEGYSSLEGCEEIDKVVAVDQSPIGRTPRSNPATYTGVFDAIRKLFAQMPEAKARGYQPGRFSFNVHGGRCEACAGEGTIRIEMHFLPDVYVPCEVCGGTRFNRDTLEIRYRGKNIAEVLDTSCEEALELFANQPGITRYLQTLVDVGLGYVRLGQSAPTLSGGEAQRVKLASELARRSTGRTLYVLDEPTTGLHFHDVAHLIEVLQRLVDQGNTVVVIEHQLDVIKSADWVIDLGPEGGEKGGTVVATGTPEELCEAPDSYTARFLKSVL